MAHETPQPAPEVLLRALDACVHREAAPSGLAGTIAIGVRADAGETWWTASFGKSTRTTSHAGRPEHSDVTLLLGVSEAAALLGLRALPTPAALLRLDGDATLLRRFIDRYLRHNSMLAVRASQTPTPRTRRGHRSGTRS